MATSSSSNSNINFACVCVATLNLIVSVIAWMITRGQGPSGVGNSTMAAATVFLSLLLLILTAFYSSSDSDEVMRSGPGVNVKVTEGAAAIDLPALPPGASEIHIKRTYKTEEIFIENKTAAPAAGDGILVPVQPVMGGAPISPYMTTATGTQPLARSGSVLSLAESYASARKVTTVQETAAPVTMAPTTGLSQQPVLVPQAQPAYGYVPPPVIQPTCPTCVTEKFEEAAYEKSMETTEIKQLPIQDLGSQISLDPSIGSLPMVTRTEQHIRLPIQTQDDVVSAVEDVQVEVICKRATTVMQPSATGPAYSMQAPMATGMPTMIDPSIPYDPTTGVATAPATHYETIAEADFEKNALLTTEGGGSLAGMSQSVVPFEPSADVFFNIEEARYQYEPDNPVPISQMMMAPKSVSMGVGQGVTTQESIHEKYLERSHTVGTTGGTIKQLPVRLLGGSPSLASFESGIEGSCANVCSRCQDATCGGCSRCLAAAAQPISGYRSGPGLRVDRSFVTCCKVLCVVLLLIALLMIPIFLFYRTNFFGNLKNILLGALKSAQDSTKGSFQSIDNMHSNPMAVGFTFGVIFICVILGTAYFYDRRHDGARKPLHLSSSPSRNVMAQPTR